MDQIQGWFEKIVGLTQAERERRAFAEFIFHRPSFDAEALHMPACWRRKATARIPARRR